MPRKNKPKIPIHKDLHAKPSAQQLIDVNLWLQEGFALHRQGRVDDAKVIYMRILEKQSNHFDTLQLLGVAYKQQGNPEIALVYFDKALQVNRINAAIFYNRGNALKDLNRLDEALNSYDEAIRIKPNYAQAYNNQGNVLKELKQLNKALISYDQATRINPNYAEAHNNQGNVLKELKQLNKALNSYDQAIRLKPDYAEAYNNRGIILKDLKRLNEALKCYDEAIRLKPDNAHAYNNRGIALQDLKRFDEALKSYDHALRLKPDFAEVYNNRGIALKDLKQLDEALKCYVNAIRLKPDYSYAYNNLGIVLQDLKKPDEALKSYDEAIRLKSDEAETYNNRGNALQDLKRLVEALKNYEEAIRLKPHYSKAYYNRGNTLKKLTRFEEALKSYDETIRLRPDYEFLFGTRLHTQMKLCDWSDLPNQLVKLKSCLLAEKEVAAPFTVLGLLDNLEVQLLSSKTYVNIKHSSSDILGPFIKKKSDGKVRIGYFSADFHNHATAYLIAELFESHDTNQFELYAFSFGPNKNDEMRHRLTHAFNQFIDVSNSSDIDIAKISRDLGVDIAVDLKGFTTESRTGIFAMRCAPIQVNFLGYPGTMGAPYIDYIVADQTVIPIESQKYYSEKIVYMPHSYQVNDAHRKISDRLFTKKELGLPEEGFIFCCFNNNYKILPETFSLWMDLLREVDGSVLWLLEDNPTATKNLRLQAQQRGIDPSRLVFAKRMELGEHLSRHRLADLCLDTLPCNAHTTASDALWAGLPVLTLPGQSFAARVAASLLSALSMPELIVESRDEYREKAVSLATNQVLMKQIKEKLDRNRLIAPLFNGQKFTKNIEKAYVAMHQLYINDQPPDHIYISH